MKKNKQTELLTLSNLIIIVLTIATYLQLTAINNTLQELLNKF